MNTQEIAGMHSDYEDRKAVTKLVNSVKRMVPADGRQDVVNHGCVSGCVGPMIYYSDTIRFYNRHETAIWALARELSESIGESVVGKIAADCDNDVTGFKNAMSWFAVEEICRMLIDD